MAPNNTNQQNQGTTNNVVTSYAKTQTTSMQSQAATQSAVQGQAAKTGTGGQNVKMVIGVFDSHQQAEKAVSELRNQGFSTEEINVVSKERKRQNNTEFVDDDITDGALTGGTLGGIGGLMVGAGALAIPGIGPIVAAGPIAAALSGAVAGGIAGGLIDWGIPAEVSRRYEQHVAEGGILAVIRSDATKVQQAAQVLRQNGARDVESHNAR